MIFFSPFLWLARQSDNAGRFKVPCTDHAKDDDAWTGEEIGRQWARTHFGFTVKTTTAERENIHQEEVLSNYVNFTGTDHCVFSPFSHIIARLDNLYSSTRRDEM